MLSKKCCAHRGLWRRFRLPVLLLPLLVVALVVANSQVFAVTEKVLWSFGAGGDGINPGGGLVMDASGNLYGSTSGGGNNGIGTEVGVVFKLTPAGQESVLWNFGLGYDGQFPASGVILDSSGNLYGATANGGLYYVQGTLSFGGTVFKLTPAGQESILWSFGNGNDGALLTNGLVSDSENNLFGATEGGGVYARGTVFELTASGEESVLWNFGNGTDGLAPSSALVRDASGNLYGTTTGGGIYDTKPPFLKGTVFKLTPTTAPAAGGATQTTWTESILWSFGNGSDGSFANSVIMDGNGDLLGTTGGGGAYAAGTVFKLTPDGQESILWNFGNGTDGQVPDGGLIMDASGNLYGTTAFGGAGLGCQGCGTVYKLSPPTQQGGSWTETILWNFGALPDGSTPVSSLVMDASGNLYGETGAGGANLSGTVFELSDVNPSGQISLSAQHIRFPKTSVGGSSSYQLAIRNTGTGQLSGTLATPPAPFGLQGSGSFNLAPHTQTKITLTFKPAAADRAHQRATITSTSIKQGSIQLDLRGIGTAPSPTLALNEAPR